MLLVANACHCLSVIDAGVKHFGFIDCAVDEVNFNFLVFLLLAFVLTSLNIFKARTRTLALPELANLEFQHVKDIFESVRKQSLIFEPLFHF